MQINGSGYFSGDVKLANLYLGGTATKYISVSSTDLQVKSLGGGGTISFWGNDGTNRQMGQILNGKLNMSDGFQINGTELKLDWLKSDSIGVSGTIPISSGTGLSPVWTQLNSIDLSDFDASKFVYGNASTATNAFTSDANTISKSGFYRTQAGATNVNENANLLHIQNASPSSYNAQLEIYNASNSMRFRSSSDGTWTNWNTVFHSGNSGSTSYDWAANILTANRGKFANLTDGYIPYHISDASGLGNSGLYFDGLDVSLKTNNGKFINDQPLSSWASYILKTSGFQYALELANTGEFYITENTASNARRISIENGILKTNGNTVWHSGNSNSTSYNWAANSMNALTYNLNGVDINSGGLNNVAYLNQANILTVKNTFNGGLTVNGDGGSGIGAIRKAGANLVIQSNTNSFYIANSDNSLVNFQVLDATGNGLFRGEVQATQAKFTTGASSGYIGLSDASGTLTWTNPSSISLSNFYNDLGNYGGFLTSESDPVFAAWDKSTGISILHSQISDWSTATSSFLTNESDPLFTSSVASSISVSNISNWNTAYSWGDHAIAGYLTNESDPAFSSWNKSSGISVTHSQVTDWSTATGSFLTSANISNMVVAEGVFNLDNRLLRSNGTGREVQPSNIVLDDYGNMSNVETITSNTITCSSTVQATTAKLTNLTDGYLPYHVSDGSGLGNSLIYSSGSNIGIGTSAPDKLLTVNGTIHAKEVLVDLNISSVPDYVFEKDYQLRGLEDLQQYISDNKHLPEVPSAKEMEEEGVNMAEINMLLLKKVEELTLYILEQDSKIKEQDNRMKKMEEKINSLK